MTAKPNQLPVATQQKAKASPLYGLAAKYNIDPNKLVDVLRGTVIKPNKQGVHATNEEVAAFCIVAQQYGLNPFTREIHAFTSGDKGVVPIVGIDGWTKIVNSRGDFDGCDFEEVAGENKKPESVTCRMYVKGRSHPVCATEWYNECYRNTGPWNQMPRRMLRHKAYMQAARYAFGLSGIFDEDEARDIVLTGEPIRETVPMPKAIDESEVVDEQPTEPTNADAVPTNHAPAAPPDPDILADDIRQEIAAAGTVKKLEDVGRRMRKSEEILGQQLYALCLDAWQARRSEIEGATANK